MENTKDLMITKHNVDEFVEAMDAFASAILEAKPELEGITLEELHNSVELGDELAAIPEVAKAALLFEEIARKYTTEQKDEIIRILIETIEEEVASENE